MTDVASDDVAREYREYQEQGRIWGSIAPERIKKIKFPRYSGELCARFLALGDMTSIVSDILDALGFRGAVAAANIAPIVPGARIAGTVVTQRNIPERKSPARGYVDKDRSGLDAREVFLISEPGDVLVADFGGNKEVSNMGSSAAMLAKMRGFAGAIVHGAIRDPGAIREAGLPVWSAGVTPVTGKYRLEAIEINSPVTVHDVVAYPGDLAPAWPTRAGVVFVPPEHVDRVLELAQREEARGDVLRENFRAEGAVDAVELKRIWSEYTKRGR